MNVKQITPITTWMYGETKTLTSIRLDHYQGYDFNGSPGYVSYTILDGDGNGVLSGTVRLTWEIVETWGEDDTPIYNFVAETLQLEIVE